MLVHRLLPGDEWVVVRPSSGTYVFRCGQPSRGLHTDAGSPSEFISTYCADAVKERLSRQACEILDAYVQPINLWMLLEGERDLLLLPERPAPQPASNTTLPSSELVGHSLSAKKRSVDRECPLRRSICKVRHRFHWKPKFEQ